MGNLAVSNLFDSEMAAVVEKYPKLSIIDANGIPILTGEIDLIDEFGDHRDTYSIEVHPVSTYPQRFPYVFETGGRLPRNVDWHVFESDGHCCIKVEPEEILICKRGITLLSFIEQQVIPYFFNQTFRRINGYFINERSHGLLGVMEYYQQLFDEKNISTILRLMHFILRGEEPNRVSLCFCGSGKKYRKCHKGPYKLLHEIGLKNADVHFKLMKELWEKINKINWVATR
jgi:hypothetical protein